MCPLMTMASGASLRQAPPILALLRLGMVIQITDMPPPSPSTLPLALLPLTVLLITSTVLLRA